MVSYDAVRRWERLPDGNPTVVDVPELAMLLATDLAVLDHFDGSVLLIANSIIPSDGVTDAVLADAHAGAVARLDAMQARLAEPVVDSLAGSTRLLNRRTDRTRPRVNTPRRWRPSASTFTPVMRSRSSSLNAFARRQRPVRSMCIGYCG